MRRTPPTPSAEHHKTHSLLEETTKESNDLTLTFLLSSHPSDHEHHSKLFEINHVNDVASNDLIQTQHADIMNNDLVLIEQLRKCRVRYRGIYLKLIERNQIMPCGGFFMLAQGTTPNDVSLHNQMSSFSSIDFSSTDLMQGSALEFLHSYYVQIDKATVQLSERLPLYVSPKSLSANELMCVSNVLKKISCLEKFTNREKIFISENLALPDCYNFLFFDNPTKSINLNGRNRRSSSDSSNSNRTSDSSSSDVEISKPGVFSKLFGKKKNTTEEKKEETKILISAETEDMYLQVRLVIFEFSQSKVVPIPENKRGLMFRSGIMIGNWFLEWKESSLVVPTRKSPLGVRFNPNYHFIPIGKIEGEAVQKSLIKLSNMCCLWNGNYVYDLKRCNHQHFVRDVVSMLENEQFIKKQSELPYGLSVEKLLLKIQKNGYTDMAFFPSDTIREIIFGKKKIIKKRNASEDGDAVTPPSPINSDKSNNTNVWNGYKTDNGPEVEQLDEKEFIYFQQHRELDVLYYNISGKFGPEFDYFKVNKEGIWDYWILKLFDRSFWVRIDSAPEPVNRNDPDYPLTKMNARFTLTKDDLEKLNSSNSEIKGNLVRHQKEEFNCPFNIYGLTTVELDMQTMVSNMTDMSYLADYEPLIPAKRVWIPYERIN